MTMVIKEHKVKRPLQIVMDTRLYFEENDLVDNMAFAGEDPDTGCSVIYMLMARYQPNGENVYWDMQQITHDHTVSAALANNPVAYSSLAKDWCEYSKLTAMHFINTDSLIQGGLRYLGIVEQNITEDFIMDLIDRPFSCALSYAEIVINQYKRIGVKVEEAEAYHSVR